MEFTVSIAASKENNTPDGNPHLKPTIYCCYIYVIFVVTQDMTQHPALKAALQNNSVLTFTNEIGHNNNINFFDVNVDTSIFGYSITSTYIKQTTSGTNLNYNSECPQRSDDATVLTMIHRTYKNASNHYILYSTNK